MESTIVTINDLKRFTNIGENIDEELLVPHLLIAQQLYAQELMGDALYFDLITQFDANTISGDTQTLYEEYVIPAIGYSAWYSSSPFLSYKTNRQGVNTQASDTITPASVEEFNLYLSKVNNLKDFYLSRLEKYLKANKTLFPLYRESSTVQSNGGSIYLGFKTI